MRRTMVRSAVKSRLELVKVRIAFFTSLTAIAGSVFASGRVTLTTIAAAACLFVLAAGSCALNEYQERETDAMSMRTMGRPIPSRRISPRAALLFSTSLLSIGFVLLALSAGWLPAFLGGFAALWYNGVYTPLKKRVPFAAVAGAISGALPPCAGWAAAGGSLADPRLAAVGIFFYLWQVPHFWLLFLSRGEDEDRSLRALVTSPVGRLGRPHLSLVTSVWMCAAAVSGTALPLFGLVRSLWALSILIACVASLSTVALGFLLLEGRGFLSSRRVLRGLHVCTVLTILTAAADRFAHR